MLLFQGSCLRVTEHVCPGKPRGVERPREERADAHEIALPRVGVYVRRGRLGADVADATTLLLFNRGEPYTVTHPVSGPDRTTIFTLDPDTLAGLCEPWDPDVRERPDRPFLRGRLPAPPRLCLAHFGAVEGSALAREEALIVALGDALRPPAHEARPASRPSSRRAHQDLVERVTVTLNRHYAEALTLKELARAVWSSPYHVCRVHRAHTGMSVHQHLTRIRLSRALARMTEGGDRRLDAIALDCGFSSHSHFTSLFRRLLGTVPAAFRRRIGWT